MTIILILSLLLALFCSVSYSWTARLSLASSRRASSVRSLEMRWGLKGAGQANKPMGNADPDVDLRDTVPFELRGFSLPAVVFSAGVLLFIK